MRLKNILLYLWQLPQNLLGLLLRWWFGDSATLIEEDHGARVYVSAKMRGGISLGDFVFVNTYQATRVTIDHELGHGIQSLMLGPLYLIVIGLPSILWAATHKKIAPDKSYYWFYTERWADRLAGIER